MSQRIARTAALVAVGSMLALTATPARAEQSGDASYTPPAGWTKQAAGPWTMWLPPANQVTPGRHVAIYVFEGAATNNPLASDFDAQILAQIGQASGATHRIGQATADAAGRESITGTASVPAADGGSTSDTFVGYHDHGRFEIAFLSSDDAAFYKQQFDAFAAMNGTLHFGAADAAPAAAAPAVAANDPQPQPQPQLQPQLQPKQDQPADEPAAEPQKPLTMAPAQGVDRPINGWTCYTDTNSFNGNFFITTCWFRPNGEVYLGRHFGGTTDADFQKLKQTDLAHCGTYGVSNGVITVQQNGDDHPTTIRGVQRYLFVLAPGQRLDNTYSRTSSMANYGNSGGFQAVAGAWYEFHADGTFKGEEYAGVDGRNGSLATGEKSDHGTYEILGPTIKFTYSNGATATMDIAGTDHKDKPDFIMLGGSDLMGK